MIGSCQVQHEPGKHPACAPPQINNRAIAFHVLRIVLGLLLLVAAGLKIHGFTIDPLSQDSFLASSRLQVAAVEVEILLGLWLLSGLAMRGAWACTIGFFVLLASVSLYQALTGQRSCGCFGAVQVNPWWTFGLDVVAIAALALFRPRIQEQPTTAWLLPVAKTALGAAVMLTVISGVFLLVFDNPTEALAKLRGEAITVEPAVSDVGSGAAGESRTFTIRLTNHTDQPVRIVGGTTSCGCVATGDLPVTIHPHESQAIKVEMKFRGSPGRFVSRFIFYTDNQDQWLLVSRFTGRVHEAASP